MTKKISVIIPNYNHEKFIKKRIESVLNQTYPIYEIIFLDDSSEDNSVEIAQSILKKSKIPYKLIINKSNSGCVFKQWYKGISLAKGDYVWIAESDDYCKPNFLKEVVKPFEDENVVLSYSQSAVVDENDQIIHQNYLHTTKHISNKWENNFIIDNTDELLSLLFIQNIIPNVSAVLFRRSALLHIFEHEKENIFNFRVAGDWYVYVLLSLHGKFFFNANALNYHRTHEKTNRNIFDYSKENEIVRNKILSLIHKILLSTEDKISKSELGKFEFLAVLKHMNIMLKSLKNIHTSTLKELNSKKAALEYLKKLKNAKHIAIFGLGKSGKMTYEFIKEYFSEKMKYFIDDNVKGEYEGILIVTTDEFLEKHQDEVDLVVFGKYQHLNPKLIPNLKVRYLKLENIV